MAKFRKKPVVVEATQWFKNGDHPEDEAFFRNSRGVVGREQEGKIVLYYPESMDGHGYNCSRCGKPMADHGVLNTRHSNPHGSSTVCPGDWVIRGADGYLFCCKPKQFAADYAEIAAIADVL